MPFALIRLVCFFVLRIAEMVFDLSFKGSVDEGLHEMLLEVFDVIKLFMLPAIYSASFFVSDWLVIAYNPVNGL